MTEVEVDLFASADTGYSIVVAGSMNPAIHHPAWYKLSEAMSDAELASTQGVGEIPKEVDETSVARLVPLQGSLADATVCSSAFSQFTAGRFRIECLQERWMITTFDRDLFVRIREIASKVFEVLTHTPVSAYGLNFNFHRKTIENNVGGRLAEMIESTRIGIFDATPGIRSAKIGYTVSAAGRALNVSIEPSVRGADMIFVGINAHHPIVVEPDVKHFDLTPLLRDSAEIDLADAERVLSWAMRAFGGIDRQ